VLTAEGSLSEESGGKDEKAAYYAPVAFEFEIHDFTYETGWQCGQETIFC
jgi:hypothetical protein